MDGQSFSREVAFSQSVINIGSDNGNDIVLRGSSVADFHVLMHYDSGRWSVSPLNGAFRTTVNGRSLSAEGAVLQNGSIVEIGTYRLTMMLNGVNTDIIIQSQGEGAAFTEEGSTGLEQNIQLAITKMEQTEIEAGAAAEIELTVTNAGPLVANMQLQLQGIPSAWVQVIPPVLNLNEGRKGTFLVRISPPRNSSAEAGLYTLHFVAISPNYPRNTGIADTALTILPYSEFLISGPTPMQLKLSHGKPTDIADFVIINNSNAVGTYFVQSRDDSNELNFAYQKTGSGALAAGQEMVTVRPGDSVQIPMEITAKKIPLLGVSAKHHHYYTNVTPSDRPGDVQTIAGEVVTKPAMNTMVLLLLLVLLLIAVGFIFQPYVHMFECQDGRRSQVIVAGGSAQLNWDVSGFASTVTLNNGQTDTEVTTKGNQYVSPTVSTTYTITAENLISSLLHITHKKTVQVLVVPSRPAIDVFGVDKGRALYDETVTLNWSVEPNATSASITTNKSTAQLAPENYTGKLAQGYQTDTLISLKAQNDSGYDLKSLFINVASDNITLTRFTVWVRPNGIAVPEDNDVRRNTRWGALQVTGGTNQPARSGVNPQPAAQSNTLEIPDNYNTTGYGTQNLNPEVMAASGQTMPSTGTSGYQPGAGSGGPSAELLVSPSLNATPVPTAAVPTALAADSVVVRATAVPAASPEGGSPNRDFSIKLAEVIEDPLADSGYRVISYYPNYVLQKQEQILVEWSVDGVSKVKIENLSGDDLQNTGSEYAYPEKSTTYTLTAQVGETKKAYSLPVNVAGDADAGEGSGLNCELKANATTLKVPGSVMLTWSGGGNNRVQLISSTQAEKENDEAEKKKEEEAKAKGEKYEKPKDQPLSGGTIGDYLQPSGFMRVNVDKQTTFVLNAYDASNNVICTKSVEVKYEGGNDKKDIKLKITKIADENGVSQPVYGKGQMVSYTVELTDFVKGTDPTGAIAITDGASTCSVNWPVNTCSFQAKKVGDLTITAVYAGDDNYQKVSATAYETVIDKMPTSIQINSAIKPAADKADVEVELMWDHNHSYGMVPTGTVTLTAGSTSCDVDMETETMTCAGEVHVVKVAKDEDEDQEKGYTAGSIYISVKNMGLKDATPDRVAAVYKGDAYFMPSTSQSVLFRKVNTQISIVNDEDAKRYPYKPDENHANLETLFNWVVSTDAQGSPVWGNTAVNGRTPTGTISFILTDSKASDYGKCEYDLTSKKFSCEGSVTPGNDAIYNRYSVKDMLLANPAADRVRAEYSGDSIFNASKSLDTVLFHKIPTTINITEAYKPDKDHANVKALLSWEESIEGGPLPTGTLKYVIGTGSCTLEIETKKLSCENNGVTISDDRHNYTVIDMLLDQNGIDRISVEYSGDSLYNPSSSTKVPFATIKTELEINEAEKTAGGDINTTITLSWIDTPPDGITPGKTIKLTLGSGTPSGQIKTIDSSDTDASGVSCTLLITDDKPEFTDCEGEASIVKKEDKKWVFEIKNLDMGSSKGDTLKAEYSGDGTFLPSTSLPAFFTLINTELEITKAYKSGASLANVLSKLSWKLDEADGKRPTGMITYTLGSGTCVQDLEKDSLSCKNTKTEKTYEEDKENKTGDYASKLLEFLLADKTADRVTAAYSGDSVFAPSTSQAVLFDMSDTLTEITQASKSPDGKVSLNLKIDPEKEHPDGLLPLGTIKFTSGSKTCTLETGDDPVKNPDKIKLTDCKGKVVYDAEEKIYKITDMEMGDKAGDTISAVYSGDSAYYKGSTSPTVSFGKADTKLTLESDSIRKEASDPMFVNLSGVLSWKQSDLENKNIPVDTKPTGTITFKFGTDVEKPTDTCKLDLVTMSFNCEGEDSDIQKVVSSEQLELTLKKILLSQEGINADRVKAVYSGDTYFNPSESLIELFKKLDPKLKIVRITDEGGTEHQWYAPEQTVLVEFDIEKGTTGKVKLSVDTASCEADLPQKSCTMKLAKVTGVRTAQASYGGDANYYNGTAEKKVSISNPKELNIEIVKTMDKEGKIQEKYGEEEKVTVEIRFTDYDEAEEPTGPVKITVDTTDTAVCPSSHCTCTINNYPEEKSCEMIAPAKKYGVDNDGKVTGHVKAEYSGNTYYKPASAAPYPFGVDGKAVEFKIEKITNQYNVSQDYYAYDHLNKISEDNKQKIKIWFTLSPAGASQHGEITAFIEKRNGDKVYCNPNPVTYASVQTCEIKVSDIFTGLAPDEMSMGAFTVNARYHDTTNEYVDKDTDEEVIIEKMIEPMFILFPAYRLLPETNQKGEFEFYLSSNSDLPETYDVSLTVDKTKSNTPSNWTYQTINFTYGSGTYTCAFTSEAGKLKCYVSDPATLDDPTVTKDDDFYDIINASLTDMTAAEVTAKYDGNTYFYAAEDTGKFYTDIGGNTQIDLKDLLKLNNGSGSFNPRTFFTALFSYNQKVEGTLPKGKMVLTLGTTTSECAFDLSGDLSEGKKFECGTLKQQGKRIEFIFENISVLNSTSSVKVKFVPSDTNYNESEAIAGFTPESVPTVSVDTAQKTASYKADLDISVTGMGPLTKKYEVYQYLNLSSKAKEEDPDSRTCKLILYPSPHLEGDGDCEAFEVRKNGDTYSLTHFQGIIEKTDMWFAAALMNEYASNPFAEGEFPVDAVPYTFQQVETNLEVWDALKYNNTHAFLSFDIIYDDEAAEEYGATPSKYLRLRTKSDDGADNKQCVICLSEDDCPDGLAPFCDDYGDQSRYAHFVIDQSAGTAHWELRNVFVSEWRTQFSLEYFGDPLFENSSNDYMSFTRNKPEVSIQEALTSSNGIYTAFKVTGLDYLTDKYIQNQTLRFESNSGGTSCDYSIYDRTFTGGCTADEVKRNGDDWVIRNLTGILSGGDTELKITFMSDHIDEDKYPNDSAEYRKLQTDIRVYDALYTPTYYAFLTVEMTYDQLGSDIFGVKPTGMLKINSDQEPTGKTCSFDLSSGAFPCGSLTQSGNKVTFIINRYWARGAAKIMYAEYGGDKFYAGDKDESSLQTENAVIEIRNAKRTNKNDHAYAAIRVSGIGSLTEKYNVYSRVRFGTIENTSSGYSISYCSFDRKTLELITSSCSVGEIRKEGDVYIIKDLAGSVLKYPDRFTAALSDNKFNSYVSATSGISYFGTTLRVSDVINLTNVQDHGRYLTLDLDYNTDFVQYYGDITPTGDINITSNSYAYSPTIGSGSCISATSTVCNRWTISEGNVHGIIQRVGGSDGEIQVQYGGDDIFRPSSKVTEFVRNITPAVTFKTQPRIYQVSGPSVRNMDLQFEVSDYELLVKYQIIYDLFIQASSGNRALNDGNMIRTSISIPDLSIAKSGGTVTRDGNTLTVTGWGKDASSDTFDNSKDRYGWAGLYSYLWPFLQTPYAVLATQRDSGSTVSFTLSLGE